MTPRRVALSLPLLFLALSLDRVLPEAAVAPPPPSSVAAAAAAVPRWPAFNEGRLGRVGNPVNLAFAGSPQAVRAALEGAGWTEVPRTIRGSLWAGLKELLAGEPVAATPPMNDYRLAGRVQDLNWAQPTSFLRSRHHFRLWRTGETDARGRDLWWGAGDYDLDVRWHDLSHVRDPDLDAERDFIAASLAASPLVERVSLISHPGVPLSGANDKGYAFRTDGRVAVVELR
ncbi:MAG: LssY C-terminal domain-containing protein [Elusimicrobiota bacterium]|nr:LssY C-terminal domain-containing protein [Elusimicrobiota bacterium]